MHSFLIVGTNNKEINEEILKITNENKSKFIEFAIGKINDVRELERFTKLSIIDPLSILIKNIDNATAEASNALLKSLEEPQDNLYFILTCENEHKVLPTISSRCHIIRSKILKKYDINIALEFIKKNASKKLLQFSRIKEREDAINYIKDLTLSFEELLHHPKLMVKQKLKVICFLKNSKSTLSSLNSNGNVLIQLTNFVIQIEKCLKN